MARYSNNAYDQYQRPIAGVQVYVYNQQTGILATLEDDSGAPLANPVVTNDDGFFYFNTDDGVYTLRYVFRGKLAFLDEAVQVGVGIPLPDSVLLALAENGGAALVGSQGPSNVQADLNSLFGSLAAKVSISALAASTGSLGVGFIQSGSDAVARTVEDRLRETISIKDFGAAFDVSEVADIGDATDDTAAWNAALVYLADIGGGTLTLPPGASKVTGVIDVPLGIPIRIVGSGTRKVYPGAFTAGAACPSTVVPVHDGLAAFQFTAAANGQGAFVGEHFNVATLETGDIPDCAFGWETGPAFPYGFTFRRLGIHGFKKGTDGAAFQAYKTSGSGLAVGAVLIEDCVINRNNWIARNLNSTSFNGFCFRNNKAGQNGYLVGNGGINISGHDIAVLNNILEANRDPVRISGAYTDINVQGNYFEANVGTACIIINGVRGPWNVGPNNYAVLDYDDIDHKVYVYSSGIGTCVDPYWSNETHKTTMPLLGNIASNNLKNTASETFCRVDPLNGANYSSRPNAVGATQQAVATSPIREINPQSGDPIPVESYSTSGSGFVSYTTTALSGSAGEWLMISWLMKRNSTSSAQPYITFNLNSGGQTQDIPLFQWTTNWRVGEWCLVTAAVKLSVTLTSFNVLLYPYGISPAAGLTSSFLRPFMAVVDDVNKVAPYIDNKFARTIAAAPTTGSWATGDTLLRSAGGLFVCTAGGSPGTWGSVVPA